MGCLKHEVALRSRVAGLARHCIPLSPALKSHTTSRPLVTAFYHLVGHQLCHHSTTSPYQSSLYYHLVSHESSVVLSFDNKSLSVVFVQSGYTEWPRPTACLIFIGHFLQLQKSPIISGSVAENDLHLRRHSVLVFDTLYNQLSFSFFYERSVFCGFPIMGISSADVFSGFPLTLVKPERARFFFFSFSVCQGACAKEPILCGDLL